VIQIGPYSLASRVLLAPMAGVSDKPTREICRRFGAGLTTTEMLSASLQVRDPKSSESRAAHLDEPTPRSVQIAGADPVMMAEAARINVALGAQIIDINMGCPVKKIMKQAAGSALLRDQPLVERILKAVVGSVDVPITLKIRTGWSRAMKNAVEIARIAEDCGIMALTIHGRTREDMFSGSAEFDTIAAVRNEIGIPLIANGDITTAQQARSILMYTGADGVMIGRGAQGRPWIFKQIQQYLNGGEELSDPEPAEVEAILIEHIQKLHEFYSNWPGLGFARKHVAWYLAPYPDSRDFRREFNRLDSLQGQLEAIAGYFEKLRQRVI
jgi:tRNA-dihydrouridine synthase B